ncbi:MAG TPA: TIGR04283 family arsenosugar biosynthesis glycosyltransferase [Pirellulaceae bacterium]|nr:TIGR04283 family arsenosugar biosynthesis glycosyltransferase [Pirellulaceae bacterium]
MHFSVVIPALNEAAAIGRAARSAWEAGALEVIVADGGSDDETAREAAKENCRVVSALRGRARQQNAGARLATGDVVLFLHADAALAPQVGAQLTEAFANPRVLSCALKQRIEAGGLAYRCLERGNAERVRWLGIPYGDQAIGVRREGFQQFGGFPDVPLLEDLLLMRQLRRQSWPVLLDGPVFVSPRRWQEHGVVRQTLRNWGILARFACGIPPARLADLYRRHDEA